MTMDPVGERAPRLNAAMTADVVVVGGGIGGLANALVLSRAGYEVRVLEQAAEFGEMGAGIQLAPNATRLMREWNLLDTVMKHGVRPRRAVLRDAIDGSELTYLDLQDVERRYGAPYVVLHRTDLHAVLVEACLQADVDLVTGVKVTELEVNDDGATAISADRRDSGDLVLAADGGFVAYRGTVPIAEVAAVTDVSADEVRFYIGPGCHLVQYALRGSDTLNQVAVFESPSSARREQNWGSPDELESAFEGACETVQRAIPFLGRDRWWQMCDREPLDRWVDRRLALTGDAAHPMLQYLAQGACQALEDADCLRRIIEGHYGATRRSWSAARGSEWDQILQTYSAIRTVRAARVQSMSRFWGDIWHCDGLSRTIRNAMLRDRNPLDYRHVDWLYRQ
jgi:2-polyprenyl-6-methoxyphenol hydroxylase-like FAD-dependent oxidoreductase